MKKWISVIIALMIIIEIGYYFLPIKLNVKENIKLDKIIMVDATLSGMSSNGEPINKHWTFKDEKANQIAKAILESIQNVRVIKRFKEYTHHDLYVITAINNDSEGYAISISNDMISISDFKNSSRYTVIGKSNLADQIAHILNER